MSLGACTVVSEPPALKDAILQARIQGKSWKEIGEQFNIGSPAQARAAFKKLTGITDFKIKGQALQTIVNQGLLDDLKKAIPKKPKVQVAGQHAAEVAATGVQGGANVTVSVIYSVDDAVSVASASRQKAVQLASRNNTLKGRSDYQSILADIKAGGYYSNITAKYGISYSDVDAIFWDDALKGGKSLWSAYTTKPTSEYGFKAVQDMVWDLKRRGASVAQIMASTDMPDNVVHMILKNTWQLPGKGSKTYYGFPTPSPAAPSSFSQTASELIGQKGTFPSMTRAQADEWVDALGRDLTPTQYSNMQRYTGSFYRQVNNGLRTGAPSDTIAEAADAISSGMRPLPHDVTLRRGVGIDTFPGGVIPEVGSSFVDRGFMSTSFGEQAAFSREVNMIIEAPAGTKARPLHQLSSFRSENEILLDRNTKFVITGTQRVGSRTDVYMRAVPH